MSADTTPTPPQRRRHLRRAAVLSGTIVAACLGLAAPATADERGLPVRGSAYAGTAPVSACTSEFVEEYRYPTEGYRVRGACTSLADWTEARAVSDYPAPAYNATEWFGDVDQDYWSDFRAQMRLPVGTLHPRGTTIEYRPTGSGMRLWTGTRPATPEQDRPVTVTMPSDASGGVALYWARIGGEHVLLDEGWIENGRIDLRIPSGAVEAGTDQQVYAAYRGGDAYPAMRTPSVGVSVDKPAAGPALAVRSPYTHIPAGTDAELEVTLPFAEGPVDVVAGGRTLGTVQMRGGRGILTAALPEGEHVLRAVHPGDGRYRPGESAPTTVTVFEPRITVESPTLRAGETLRATATLPAGASGRVQFLLTWPGNMAGIGSADLVDGTATFAIPADRIGAGTFGLAVDHRGGAGFLPSRSEPVTVTIAAASAASAR